MDPLSIIGGIATALHTANKTISIINGIRNAPEEISALSQQLESLNSLLRTTEQRIVSQKELCADDTMIAQTVEDCTKQCTESLNSLNETLQSYSAGGVASKGLFKRVGWMLNKDEMKSRLDNLRDSKASLQFALVILGHYMNAKTREDGGLARSEILLAISNTEQMLLDQFRDVASAAKLKKQLDDDVMSVYTRNQETVTLTGESLTVAPTTSLGSGESGAPRTLIEAVSTGNKAAVLELLSKGARVMERSDEGSTALHYCARYNDRDIAEILIERGAPLDVRNNERLTAFGVCLREDSYDVAELLIEKGCSVSSVMGDILQVLAKDVNVSRWDPVLKTLANPFNEPRDVPQLLHIAIERKDSALLKKLLELGFDPNVSENGYQPIHQAIIHQRRRDVRLLIKKGADVNAFLPSKARRPGGTEPRHKLLSRLERRGYTPLLLAASIANDVSIVQLLLAHGANPNFVFPAGDVVLNCICAPQFLNVATDMIKGGANVNFQNANDGCGALFWAVNCGNRGLVNVLLDHGADISIQTMPNMGCLTPLHAAVTWGRIEEAMVLINRGADQSLKDVEGLTPVQRARKMEKLVMVQLLSAHGSGGDSIDGEN